MPIRIVSKGDLEKTKRFGKKVKTLTLSDIFERYAEIGKNLLAENTPKDSGETALCWAYEIEHGDSTTTITWHNTNIENGTFHVALALQYGHGTGTGGYVQGIDYINPAIQQSFEALANELWREVTSIE